MNWIAALDAFFKAKDVYGKLAEVKKLNDYAKKVSSKKSLDWDDLKYFKNPVMEKALKNAKSAVAAADAALKVKVDWPDSGSLAKFAAALKAAGQYGHDSPQAKKAVEAYRKCLVDYDKVLTGLVKDMTTRQKQLKDNLKLAKMLEEYGRTLHDAFMTCAKIPMGFSTAPQAEFFSLSQDAQNFAGHMNSLASRTQKLIDRNAKAMTEGNQLIKDNKAWIDWASKGL